MFSFHWLSSLKGWTLLPSCSVHVLTVSSFWHLSHAWTLHETGPALRGFLLVILSRFWEICLLLPHARSRLRGPPADNYRYLFFINEVKSQLSLSFLELRGKLFRWWLGSFNRCLFYFKWVNICIHVCWLGWFNTRVFPIDTHLAQFYSKQ